MDSLSTGSSDLILQSATDPSNQEILTISTNSYVLTGQRLSDGEVMSVLATIIREPQGPRIECETPGLIVNKKPTKSSVLKPGDFVQVGYSTYHVIDTGCSFAEESMNATQPNAGIQPETGTAAVDELTETVPAESSVDSAGDNFADGQFADQDPQAGPSETAETRIKEVASFFSQGQPQEDAAEQPTAMTSGFDRCSVGDSSESTAIQPELLSLQMDEPVHQQQADVGQTETQPSASFQFGPEAEPYDDSPEKSLERLLAALNSVDKSPAQALTAAVDESLPSQVLEAASESSLIKESQQSAELPSTQHAFVEDNPFDAVPSQLSDLENAQQPHPWGDREQHGEPLETVETNPEQSHQFGGEWNEMLPESTPEPAADTFGAESPMSNTTGAALSDRPTSQMTDELAVADTDRDLDAVLHETVDRIMQHSSGQNQDVQSNLEQPVICMSTGDEDSPLASDQLVEDPVEHSQVEDAVDAWREALKEGSGQLEFEHQEAEVEVPAEELVAEVPQPANPNFSSVFSHSCPPGSTPTYESGPSVETDGVAAEADLGVGVAEPNDAEATDGQQGALAELDDQLAAVCEPPVPMAEAGLQAVFTEHGIADPAVGQQGEFAEEDNSVAAVLARMNMTPDVDVDAAQDIASVEAQMAEAAVAAQPSEQTIGEFGDQSESQPADGEDSEDVQSYMNSLLQRLNGGVPENDVQPNTTNKTVPAESPKQTKTVFEQTEYREPVQPLRPDEFVPKRVAPEVNSNMAAMRELANAATRNALTTSMHKKSKLTKTWLMTTACSSLLGMVFFFMLSHDMADIFAILSMACGVLGVAIGAFFLFIQMQTRVR